jgi:hypothetical protein
METLIVVGSSLAGALIALANEARSAPRRIILVEAQHRFGGGPAQPFFSDALSDAGQCLVADAIVGEWPHYMMLAKRAETAPDTDAQPDLMQFDRPVSLLAPEQVHADLVTLLRPEDLRLHAQIGPLSVGKSSVDLGNERIEGDAVLDLRPARAKGDVPRIEVELGSHLPEGAIPLSAPVLADATIDAGPAGVLQYFPMDPRWLIMRRMRFLPQGDPGTSRDSTNAPVGSEVMRHTTFVFDGPSLPIPMPVPSALLPSEVPGSVALALALAQCASLADLDATLRELASHHRNEGAKRWEALLLLAGIDGDPARPSLPVEALQLASQL